MKQIQGFTNKIAVPSFHRDSTWQTVTLSGLDPDTKFVEIELIFETPELPPNVYVGLRPTGTTLDDAVWLAPWLGQWSFPTYTTLTMRVNSSGEVDFNCNQPEGIVDFYVTGEWGGDAVVDFGANYPQATGWTVENSGTYREFDLTPLIPVEDRGNVEAVLFFAAGSGIQLGHNESADARANGSTLDYYSPNFYFRETRIAKVDNGNLIEVREDALYTKGVPGDQNSFVYFAGYIRRGSQDDGTGNFYAFDTIVDGVADEVDNDVWTAYDVRPVTSPDVAAIYWNLKAIYDEFQHDYYCREIGSTDAAQGLGRTYQANKILDVDANYEVEHKLTIGLYRGTRIYGWLDFLGVLPDQATDPVPVDGATNIGTEQDLSWTAGAGADSHDVYFGTTPTPGAPEFRGNQPGTTFEPGSLIFGQTYYWRIDEVNEAGTTAGIVWVFTVGIGPVPEAMHGALRIDPLLDGDVELILVIDGDVTTKPLLGGDVELKPLLRGDVEIDPLLGGSIEISKTTQPEETGEDTMIGTISLKPLLGGDVETIPALGGEPELKPLLDGDAKTKPLLDGTVSPRPALEGEIEVVDERAKR